MKGILYFTWWILASHIPDIQSSLSDTDLDKEQAYHPRARRQTRSGASIDTGADIDWVKRGQDELKATLNVMPIVKPARNVILFIGDGMGVSTLTAARIFKAQEEGTPIPDTSLSWESFPATGLSMTYNTDQQTADSAGTATAFLSGEKTRAGVVGLNQRVLRGDCEASAGNEVKSLLHHGMDEGKWAGVVTTTRITHATPASSYAHAAERDWEDDSLLIKAGLNPDMCWDIARQLVHGDNNDKIRVILGGGRVHFLSNTTSDPEYPERTGQRLDGRDLRHDWLDVHKEMGLSPEQYAYVENKTDFHNIDTSNVEYLLGLFEPSHMKYEADRLEETGDSWTEPSLAEMVQKALDILKRGPNGYVLLVEGGRIDHAHHDTNAYRALSDTVAMETAVGLATDLTSEQDTLIVVTADHSHVFTIGGYQALDNDIMGLVVDPFGTLTLADDGKPYLTLAYANGPGFLDHRTANGSLETESPRKNLTAVPSNDKTFLQDTSVPLDSETHGGEDVAVYARGPMSHLFMGQHEQSYIAHAAMYAACLGWNKDLCSSPDRSLGSRAACSGTHSVTVGRSDGSGCFGIVVLVALGWLRIWA